MLLVCSVFWRLPNPNPRPRCATVCVPPNQVRHDAALEAGPSDHVLVEREARSVANKVSGEASLHRPNVLVS